MKNTSYLSRPGSITVARGTGTSRRARPALVRALLDVARSSKAGGPRVLLAGKLTGMSAPGGGETQLRSLAECLPKIGVDARPWRPWEDPLSEADCLHLVGSQPEFLPVVVAARQARIPVVLSPVAWFDLSSYARESRPWYGRVAACGRFLARAAVPTLPSWRRRLYMAVDRLLPNSQAEAEQLVRLFGVARQKIHVVYNGADERLAHGRPEPFVRHAGIRDFVLYAGRIEPRKNQLGFLRAMRASDVPIVMLGDFVPGYKNYLAECRRVAGANVRFVDRVDPSGELLASAYAACRCLVLASWYETPGLVALEAGMSGVPLVMPKRGAAREYFGQWASYVAPGDLSGIRREVLTAWQKPRSPQLARHVRSRFTWLSAARATREVYEKVL